MGNWETGILIPDADRMRH